MTSFWNDLRYAVRQLRKSPGFAALAICTLAIGIGASTAIYSIVDGVLLRSLPFRNPQRLVEVYESFPALGFKEVTFSAPDLRYVEQHARSFSGIAAYRDQEYELSGSGTPERIRAERVSSSLSSVLGVEPMLGRFFTQQEDANGAAVVMLSNRFWRQHFAASRDAIGQKILLDRKPYTVIAVMRRSFVFPSVGEKFNNQPGAVFTPMHFTPKQLQDLGNEFNYSAVARLRPGVSMAAASAEVNGLIHRFTEQYPIAMRSLPGFSIGGGAARYSDQVVGDSRTPLLLLQISVLLVLLIACVDVANLLLARTAGRQREFALRVAVGAPKSRILAQLISESLVLALGGGLLALPLAWGAMHLLLRAAPTRLPNSQSIGLNAGVLAFCLGVSVLTALLTGLVPALRSLRVDPNESLSEGGRSGAGGRGRHRVLNALVVAQFALAMVLLVTAGLVLRSFQRLVASDPGFRPERVLTMSTTLPLSAYSTQPQIKNFYRQVLDRVAPLPGVGSVGLTTSLPLHIGEHDVFSIEAQGSRPEIQANVSQTWVMGDYFRAMGIRLLRGRYFTPQDREGSQPVAIIGKTFAEKQFPGINPIGHRIKHGISVKDPWMVIVGEVEDVKSDGMHASAASETYLPYLQETGDFFVDPNIDEMRNLSLAVRTRQQPASMQNLLVATIHSIDPSLPVTHIRTMKDLVHRDVAPERFNSFVLGVFAAIALLLAAAGIGGVLAYTVHQRTREIGVRMALGAQRGNVSRLVLREGMRLACIGGAVGGAIALGVSRLLASQLYDIAPYDPATFLAGAALLVVLALLACWIPARRAASVDPMQALRAE